MTKVVFKSRRTPSETIVTKENQAMTIPTSIKETNPSLYARHVVHFGRAKAFTYNYYPQDEIILENYAIMSIKEIAHMLNEYVYRIQYRVEVLQSLGLLAKKRVRRTKVQKTLDELNARKEFHEAEAKKADDDITKVLTDGMEITWTKAA
jgi:hypothetical protein